jgi:hypothetical protein
LKLSTRTLEKTASLFVGLFLGLLLVFHANFSDIFILGERLLTSVLLFLVYAFVGFLFGYLRPEKSWRWGYWLSAPALFFVFFFSLLRLGPSVLLYGLYAVLALGSAGSGAYLGNRMRRHTLAHHRFPSRGESQGD